MLITDFFNHWFLSISIRRFKGLNRNLWTKLKHNFGTICFVETIFCWALVFNKKDIWACAVPVSTKHDYDLNILTREGLRYCEMKELIERIKLISFLNNQYLRKVSYHQMSFILSSPTHTVFSLTIIEGFLFPATFFFIVSLFWRSKESKKEIKNLERGSPLIY